jgi:hypothetical protein
MHDTGPRGGCTFALLPPIALVIAVFIWALMPLFSPAHGMAGQFGTYSPAYEQRRAEKARARRAFENYVLTPPPSSPCKGKHCK